jgi:glycosyltransferase involved in cell wall biosynthesis
MSSLRIRSRAPLILDEHNLEYELLERTVREERSPLRKLYNWIEYRKLRREEHRNWRRADVCIFTSPRERDIFGAFLPEKRAIVVPNGVDVDYFRPTHTTPDPSTIVFTGLMRYRPNADAVISFVREILPRIRHHRPEAVFTIVGSGVPPEVARLAGPNVVVTGTVADVRPYVARSAAFVVPLRMGSGTRLKVLEGLAMGKAMVSTTLGCEGIAVRDGEHLLVADEPDDFARAVLRLFDAQDGAAALGARGRALVEQEYAWGSIYSRLESFYVEMIREAWREPDIAAVTAQDRDGAPAIHSHM